MTKGKIKWFNQSKGYGFIAGEDGQDYFMHHSQLPQGCEPKGDEDVEFTAVETKRGKQAQGIELLG